MSSTTVRISQAARETLKLCASQTGEPMQTVLEKAVEQYRRQLFLEQTNAAFAVLRANPDAWQIEQEERTAWDVTLADHSEEG